MLTEKYANLMAGQISPCRMCGCTAGITRAHRLPALGEDALRVRIECLSCSMSLDMVLRIQPGQSEEDAVARAVACWPNGSEQVDG